MSSVSPKLAGEAVALAPASVLRLLAGVVPVGEEGGQPPVVALHLTGGQVLDGHLVRVGAEDGHEVVVLSGPASGELTYVLTAHLAAVTVPSPAPVQDVLTAGALPAVTPGSPPTSLELRRGYPATAEFPLELDWQAVPDSGDAMANLGQLLASLRRAVEAIRADEMGRQAWAQVRVLRVAHEAGRHLVVLRESDRLLVKVDLSAALPRQLTGDLRSQLDDLL